MRPIWQRYEVNLGTASSREFFIETGGVEIYRGVAYARPGETQPTVVINDICRDYLAALPASGSILPDPGDPDTPVAVDVPLAAEFYVYSANPTTLRAKVTFLLDWSYDTIRAAALNVATPTLDLGDPIFPEVNDAIPLLYTAPNSRTLTYGDPDDPEQIATTGPGVFAFGPSWLTGSSFSFHDSVKNQTVTYQTRAFCGEWFALYYLNAYGGWDQLTCDGRSLHSRSYERRMVTRDANNNADGIAEGRRGVKNYGTSETDRWQLSTPFLTDAQAAKMHHLLGSREVWLVASTDTGTFLPVTIETESVETKTWRNQDGGMIAYSFTVKLAEDRQR